MRYRILLLFFAIMFSLALKVCSDNLNVELLGRYSFSGRVIDVYVVNDYAYICTDNSLIILDVSKPSNPSELGRVDTINSKGVCLDGDYAYVADKTGLRLIDISDPKNPHIVAIYHTKYYAVGVYVSERYAYLVDTDVFHIIDVSDPRNPNEVGSCAPPGFATGGICVSGSYAYVTCGGKPIFDDRGFHISLILGGEGLAVLDISNPLKPKNVGFYHSNDSRGVYVVGNYAYVAGWLTGMDAGLQIVDISDPTVPKKVGSIVTHGISDDVYVDGKYAYLADGRKFQKPYSGLRVIDVSDPNTPREIGFYDTPYSNSDPYNIYVDGKAYGVYAIGNHVYLADGDGGLCILRYTGEVICAKGDVNDDGSIKSNDAILALRISAGLITPTSEQQCAADMNGDGSVRANDAILILRKAAGLGAPLKNIIAKAVNLVTVALDEIHGLSGQSITVPVKIDNTDIATGGDICITYDSSVLRAVSAESEHDVLIASNVLEPGKVKIAFATTDKLNSKTLANIKFDILTDKVSPLILQSVELYSHDAIPINSGKVNGRFSSWAMRPEQSALLQNFPNPFNPDTWIPYQLKEGSDVKIWIYNVSGELVRKLELGYKPAGLYTSRDRATYWDGKDESGVKVASGIYFYRIQAKGFSEVKKMIVLK